MDPVADVDWSMGSHAARLADWDAAIQLGKRVAGAGPPVPPEERARMREDLAAPRKQRHTARRIFERLADEHAAQVSYSHVCVPGT